MLIRSRAKAIKKAFISKNDIPYRRTASMKIVLINPPISSEQVFGNWDLSGLDTYCPPLGLLYIASFAREHQHNPYIVDINVLKWSVSKVVEFVLSSEADVVGITSTTVNVNNANKIAEEIKGKGFRGAIVIGGSHVTALPVETLKRFKAFDFGVVGEGEVTFLELIEKIGENGPAADVKGIVWRNKGEVVLNPVRPLLKDLDVLPLPAWDLLPNFPAAYPHNALETKRQPSATILTSRGCPNHCTFCDRSVYGNTVRHHSAQYTLNMIRYLRKEYGVRDLMIVDDNFLIDKKKLFDICDKMIEEKMNITWYCLGHVKFMTEDRLKRMREAGCWIMEVGIESGCDRILKFIKKNITKAEIAAAAKRAKEAGIRVKGNFIFGFPTETKESIEETIQFAKSIDISLFQQTYLTILPGCEMAKDAEKYGDFETDWDKFSMYKITFVPHGLTKEDLLKASKDAFRRFYLRPKIILENLSSLTSLCAMQTAILSFWAFIKTMRR
jgi:anaerobic magnesium-protoporphyrin IX monomethyl ester cyclase